MISKYGVFFAAVAAAAAAAAAVAAAADVVANVTSISYALDYRQHTTLFSFIKQENCLFVKNY